MNVGLRLTLGFPILMFFHMNSIKTRHMIGSKTISNTIEWIMMEPLCNQEKEDEITLGTRSKRWSFWMVIPNLSHMTMKFPVGEATIPTQYEELCVLGANLHTLFVHIQKELTQKDFTCSQSSCHWQSVRVWSQRVVPIHKVSPDSLSIHQNLRIFWNVVSHEVCVLHGL